jgi:hypothetical protein
VAERDEERVGADEERDVGDRQGEVPQRRRAREGDVRDDEAERDEAMRIDSRC